MSGGERIFDKSICSNASDWIQKYVCTSREKTHGKSPSSDLYCQGVVERARGRTRCLLMDREGISIFDKSNRDKQRRYTQPKRIAQRFH
jgi:hypothetical protein